MTSASFDELRLIELFRALPDDTSRDKFLGFALRIRNGDSKAIRLANMLGAGQITLQDMLNRLSLQHRA